MLPESSPLRGVAAKSSNSFNNRLESLAREAFANGSLQETRGCDRASGPSSAAHSRELRPRWNFWSRGPLVVVRGGHRGCEHSGKLAKTHRICGAPVELDKKVFSLKVFGAAVTSVRRSNRRHHFG